MSNPFLSNIQQNTDTANTDNLPLLREYAWDFLHDCFILNEDGKAKIVTGQNALKVWIYKCLKTERFRYRAYEDSYGVELEKFIGKRVNNDTTAAEIQSYIIEALDVNPYIIKINSITITDLSGDNLSLSINLTSVYGDLVTSVTI